MKLISLAIIMLLHPVHVSLTGIDYDRASRVYSIFVKVYCDDLESDMKMILNIEQASYEADDKDYYAYLCDRIKILEDGKILGMKLITSEKDGLERKFTLEAKGGKSVKTVTVIDRIMTRLYTDQSNMLLFSFNGIEDGYKFTTSDTLRNYNVK